MDTFVLSSTPDQSISTCKQKSKNHKMNQPLISRTNENFAPFCQKVGIHGGDGLLIRPPQRSLSFSTIPSRQPPLLPLPISKPYCSYSSSLPNRNNNRGGRALSTSPSTNKKPFNHKGPKSSDAPKKSESSPCASKSTMTGAIDRLGQVTGDVPGELILIREEEDDVVGGWIFSLAPPPSCLPLPKFHVKPKVGCNVEAATRIDASARIDACATTNLRKLLHLC